MIVLWIILGIIALLLLILLLPVHLTASFNGQLKAHVRILFFKYTLYPFPPENKLGKGAKKQASKIKKSQFAKTEDMLREEGVSTLISYFTELSKLLASTSKQLIKAITVDKLRLNIIVAGIEASQTAIDYGRVCAVVYPVVALIESAARVRKCAVNIKPDFLIENGHVDGEMDIHILPLRALWVGLVFFIKFLGNTTSIKMVKQ